MDTRPLGRVAQKANALKLEIRSSKHETATLRDLGFVSEGLVRFEPDPLWLPVWAAEQPHFQC